MKKEFLLAALMVGTTACAHNPGTQAPAESFSAVAAPWNKRSALEPEYQISLAQTGMVGNSVKIDAIYKGCTADHHLLAVRESVFFPVASAMPMTEQTLSRIGTLYAQTVGRNMDSLTTQTAPYTAYDPAIQKTLPRVDTKTQMEIAARNADQAGDAFVTGLLKQRIAITAFPAGGILMNVSNSPVPECS